MKHDTIKTDNYLLVVDESSIKNGDWVYFECLPYSKEIKQVTTIINNAFDSKEGFGYGLEHCKKIISHLPLNDSPILEGVDLLPPLEQEDDVEKIVDDLYPDSQYEQEIVEDRKLGFISGYNKAKEKYKYTEEDMYMLAAFVTDFIAGRKGDFMTTTPKNVADKFIQSLSQPKMPIGFVWYHNYVPTMLGEHIAEPKTTTTPEGHTQWVGTYIYG